MTPKTNDKKRKKNRTLKKKKGLSTVNNAIKNIKITHMRNMYLSHMSDENCTQNIFKNSYNSIIQR